jgi:hypothetical protein
MHAIGGELDMKNQQDVNTLLLARFQLSEYLETKGKQYPLGEPEDAYLFLLDIFAEMEALGFDLANYTIVHITELVCECKHIKTLGDSSIGLSVATSSRDLQVCVI